MALDNSNNEIHMGHRERLRQRFIDEGLDSFEDHQVLELLLFYAIPRKDTNPTAHQLLNRFGSLSAVLDSDITDLSESPGVGESAGALLSLMPAISRRYQHDRCTGKRLALNSPEKTAGFIVPLMTGRTEEVFYVVNLDAKLNVIVPSLVGSGTVGRAHVEPRHVVEAALRSKAHAVILGHNHPTGKA